MSSTKFQATVFILLLSLILVIKVNGAPTCIAGTMSTNRNSVHPCEKCPMGKYCTGGNSNVSCSGYSMAGAASSGDCLSCPAGYECIGHGLPSPCGKGKYSNVNSTSCSTCSAGYYCMLGIRYDCNSNSGYYSYGGEYYQDESGATNCKYVPPGSYKYNRASIRSCGSSKSAGGSSSCSSCPGNTICSGNINIKQCPPGTTMSSFGCNLCAIGSYCPGGTTTTQGVTSSGSRYFVAGKAQYQYVDIAGSNYQDFKYGSTSTFPVSCYHGETRNSGRTSCDNCRADGYYCPSPHNSAVMCPNGLWQSDSYGRWAVCKGCYKGYACKTGLIRQQCQTYHYQTSSFACAACPQGRYCTNRYNYGSCHKGTYSSGSNNGGCTGCQQGWRCPGANTRFRCGAGTYSGLKSAICASCPMGAVCYESRTHHSSYLNTLSGSSRGVITCGWGYHMPSNPASAACNACNSGKYCPNLLSTSELPCPTNYTCPTYSYYPKFTSSLLPYRSVLISDKWSRSQNLTNNIDRIYDNRNVDTPLSRVCTESAPAPGAPGGGDYVPATSYGYKIGENFRFYSNGGASPGVCPVNKDCTFSNLYFHQQSPISDHDCNGYTYSLGEIFCYPKKYLHYDCNFGYYDQLNEQTGNPEFGRYTECNVRGRRTDCFDGTYTTIGYGYCMADYAGYRSLRPSGSGELLTKQYCSGGYTCSRFMDWRGALSTTYHMYCPPTTYIEDLSNVVIGVVYEWQNCMICPSGYYCPGNSMKILCAAGQVCPKGSSSAGEVSCPLGSFADNMLPRSASSAACKACTAGKYCEAGTTTVSGDCPAGYFCPEFTMDPQQYPVDKGYYHDFSSSIALSARPGTTCPVNTYCPTRTIYNPSAVPPTGPMACPQGTYNGLGQLEANTQCTLCDPGTKCPPSPLFTTVLPCDNGRYCPPATSLPIFCPRGTYHDPAITNLKAQSQCIYCTPGKSCENQGGVLPLNIPNAAATFDCGPAHFCPLGTKNPNQFPCGEGKKVAAGTMDDITDCVSCTGSNEYCEIHKASTTCPDGFKCQNGLKTVCPDGQQTSATADHTSCASCASGKFCKKEYIEHNPIKCPPGTFSSGGQSSCSICSAGAYCGLETATPSKCNDGEWAIEGTLLVTDCSTCEKGYKCTQSGGKQFCTGGKDCTANGYTEVTCAAGYECKGDGTPPTICPSGYWTSSAGGASTCVQTDAGKFSAQGQHNGSGSGAAQDCNSGYYCQTGSKSKYDTPCPEGKADNTGGGLASETCATCPAGKFCQRGTTVGGNEFACELGEYCAPQTVLTVLSMKITKCDKGSMGTTQNKSTQGECDACPAGKACAEEGITQSSEALNCDAGYYCLGNTTTTMPSGVNGDVCPKGAYCPSTSPNYVSCTAGQFNMFLGSRVSGDCEACIAGQYCSGTNVDKPTGYCKPGWFCPTSSSSEEESKSSPGYYTKLGQPKELECPKGTFALLEGKADACDPCTLGFYCPTMHLSVKIPCIEGSYCKLGSVNPVACPVGTYRLSTQAGVVGECLPCTNTADSSIGANCPTFGIQTPSPGCSQGFFCKWGAFSSAPMYTQNIANTKVFGPCPKGYFCPTDTISPQQCLAGTYSTSHLNYVGTQCTNCWQGYFCPSNAQPTYPHSPTHKCNPGFYCPKDQKLSTASPATHKCPLGHYCPLGTSKEIACAPGTWNNQLQQSTCPSCPISKFCALPGTTDANAITPPSCPFGYYCPTGTDYSTKFPCDVGSHNNDSTGGGSAGDCETCPAKEYCGEKGLVAGSGDCKAGFFCEAGSRYEMPMPIDNTGRMCTIGEYCLPKVSVPASCDQGYYCDKEQMVALDTSKKCLPGHWCDLRVAIGAPILYYNLAADTIIGDYCPTGQHCPQQSLPLGGIDCLKGTYQPSRGAQTINYCVNCPMGKFCPLDGQTTTPDDCPDGYFCIGTQFLGTDNECPIGYYCPTGTSFGGAINKIVCPAGYYRDAVQGTLCTPCPPGFYCPFNTATGCAAKLQCEKGYECPNTNMDAPIPCIPGKYQDAKEKQSCNTCDIKKFCDREAMEAPSACPLGYICPSGTLSVTDADLCPDGSFCSDGSETLCTGGKYCSGRGQFQETGDCPAGYYCPTQSNDPLANMCGYGHYCPGGEATGRKCGIGTYNDYKGSHDIGDCRKCPAGFTCTVEFIILSSEPKYPDSNHYCPAGQYCEENSVTGNTISGACPRGYKCPAGIRDPELCQPGTYQDDLGQSVCKTCVRGNYCNFTYNSGGGLTVWDLTLSPIVAQQPCPQGYYCPENTGTYEMYPCERGRYGDGPSKESSTDCTPCTIHKFCLVRAKSSVSGDCLAGYQCPQQSDVPALSINECDKDYYCPAGVPKVQCASDKHTFKSTTGADQLSDCLDCPPGMECANHNTTTTTCTPGKYCQGHDHGAVACPPGTFCVGANREMRECPPGTYSSVSSTECTVCPLGYKCEWWKTGYRTAVDYDYVECSSNHICETSLPCPEHQLDLVSQAINCYTGASNKIGSYKSRACVSGEVHDAANDICVSCPKGGWCWPGDTTENSNRGDCTAGWICQGGAISPTPWHPMQAHILGEGDFLTYNGRAALGHYSTLGSTANIICSTGTFVNSPGVAHACLPCLPGFQCSTQGIYHLPPALECDNGVVCGYSAVTDAIADPAVITCTSGYYCPKGTSFERNCKDGKFTNSDGQHVCVSVPAGQYRSLSVDGIIPVNCKSGNAKCIGGDSYEPKCGFGYYGSGNVCEPCTAGKYCRDGTNAATCTAGYLCTGISSEPDPTGTGGTLCPAGGYCPHGTAAKIDCPCVCNLAVDSPECCDIPISVGTSCPMGNRITCANTYEDGAPLDNDFLYRFTEMGRQARGCIPCIPGYTCLGTNQFKCKTGHYCPAEEDTAIPCPLATYNQEEGLAFKEDCTNCPKGYFCNETALSALTGKECSTGRYCYERMLDVEVECPAGYYRENRTGIILRDCAKCPPGFKCAAATTTPVACVDGQLCKELTSIPSPCPGGYYCNSATNFQQLICPKNNYCPINSSVPLPCLMGQKCPEGSELPIKCVAGYVSLKTDDGYECTICGKGFYSEDGKWPKCLLCTPGYVCDGGTMTRFPYLKTAHGGWRCPRGHYCPAGSSSAIACPVGSFNPLDGRSAVESCKLCEKNTYNDEEGQGACLTCGNSAEAEAGSTTCECAGKNRAFQKTDSSCRCLPQYEYWENGELLSEDNAKSDCQPKVYERCGNEYVRDDRGKCRKKDDCSNACGGGQGKRSSTIGLCQCNSIKPLNTLCNKSCRKNQPTLRVNEKGRIVIRERDKRETVYESKDLDKFDTTYMKYIEGKESRIANARLNSEGKFSSVYGVGPRLATKYASTRERRMLDNKTFKLDSNRRYLVASSTEIESPIICIHDGDTMMFDIDSASHYPIYVKDSLANTNPHFDYGAFKILAAKLIAQKESGVEYAQTFAFTFIEPGNYFFMDANDPDQTLIVSVKKEAEKCPNEDAYIQPRTTSTLATFGITLNDDIQLNPDYVMLLLIMGTFLAFLLFLVLVMKYFADSVWNRKPATNVFYRNKNRRFNFHKLRFLFSRNARKMDETTINKTFDVTMLDLHTTAHPVMTGVYVEDDLGLDFIDRDFVSDSEDPKSLQQLEELDLAIVEKILETYKSYKDFLRQDVFPVTKKHSEMIEEMLDLFERLKFMANERYERMLKEMPLDLDYTRLDGVRVGVEQEGPDPFLMKKKEDPKAIKLDLSQEGELNALLTKQKLEHNQFKKFYIGGGEFTRKGEEKGIIEHWDEKADIERKREEKTDLVRKLRDAGELTELERKQLIEDYENEMLNLEELMEAEMVQQEIELRKLLRDNKKRRVKKHAHDLSVITKEESLEPTTKEGRKEVEKINKQIEVEKEQAIDHLMQNTLEKVSTAREEFLHKLGARTPEDKKLYMRIHEGNWEKITQQIEADRNAQQSVLQKMLHKRKQRLIKQAMKGTDGELIKGMGHDPGDVDEDDIQDIIDREIDDIKTEHVQKLTISKLEKKQEKERRNLDIRLNKDRKEIEREIDDDLTYEVEKEMTKKQLQVDEQFRITRKRIEDERRKLNDKLLFVAADKNEARKLRTLVQKKEEEIAELITVERNTQQHLLQDKINKRKIAKMRRMQKVEKKMENEKLNMNIVHLKEKQEVESEDELQIILKLIDRLQNGSGDYNLNKNQIQHVFDKMIGDKHAKELSAVLCGEFAEKEEQLREVIKQGMENKMLEKEDIKKKYGHKYNELKLERERLGDYEFEERTKDIKVEEANELKEVDIQRSMRIKKDISLLRQSLEDKHANEFIELKERQIEEKEELLGRLFGLLKEEDRDLKVQLRTAIEQKEKEREKRKKDIELEKKIILDKYEREMQERFNDFDEVLGKQREAEKKIMNKKGNIEKILRERKINLDLSLNKKVMFTKARQKDLLEIYTKELMDLESIMEGERNRQYLAMRDKLEHRNRLKERAKRTNEKALQFFVGGVQKKQAMEQIIKLGSNYAPNINEALRSELERWKIDMHERERHEGVTTFSGLNYYMNQLRRHDDKGLDGVYLDASQYRKYWKLMEKAIQIEDFLNDLRAVRIMAELVEINKLADLFSAEMFDFERGRQHTQRIGGGYVVMNRQGSLLNRFFKMLSEKNVNKEIRQGIVDRVFRTELEGLEEIDQEMIEERVDEVDSSKFWNPASRKENIASSNESEDQDDDDDDEDEDDGEDEDDDEDDKDTTREPSAVDKAKSSYNQKTFNGRRK